MESEIEIIQPKKRNYKKLGLTLFGLVVLALVIFFGYRAYSMTKRIIVAKSSSASPYLSSGSLNETDISKFESGDRRINILLLGLGGDNHPGGNLTDTIQVLSIDPKNKKVAILSIPRDLYIKVNGHGSYKINAVYSLEGNGLFNAKPGSTRSSEEESAHIDLIKKTVGDFLGVPIHYAVVVNFDGFKEIVDILGGVDIDVKEDLYDPYYPDQYMEGYDELFIKAGMNHFDGEMALKYARSRETTSDFDRARRQQEVMKAVKEKALKTTSIKKISQIINVLSNNLKTDLQISDIEELAKIAGNISNDNIETKVLDDSADGVLYADRYDEAYVLVPKDETLKELHLFVSQYFKDPLLSEENSKIMILNGSKNSFSANSLLDKLKTLGYNAEIEENTEKKVYTKTFIYDYSSGSKKATVDFLKKYLNNVSVITLNEKNKGYDIEIVIGSDFKSNTL